MPVKGLGGGGLREGVRDEKRDRSRELGPRAVGGDVEMDVFGGVLRRSEPLGAVPGVTGTGRISTGRRSKSERLG